MARKKQQFTTYSNLAQVQQKSRAARRRDAKKRERAEQLASLPKNPVARFFAHFSPKRVLKYWFSWRGVKTFAKILGIFILLVAIGGGALFMYFRKELDSLKPEELQKRVATTVNYYYDRNGELLWEDTGTGEYRLVVESGNIAKYMKDATVAIEDKDFYKHGGVSVSGIARAVINNIKGGSTQGASTLTQQLVKQVFFADEAGNRGLAGVPRKIKEAILSIEAERTYTKDQILTMYLNESPYGGRRNGVESAAQTYFGKDAKDLTLAESALLAAIPQDPSRYNPYMIQKFCTGTNAEMNQCSLEDNSLIRRQQVVLNYMAQQGYISQAEADEAKKVAVLDELKPENSQLTGAKAPHFIQMVKQDVEQKLGAKVVGQGGLKITTTLDIRVQNVIDAEMDKLFAGPMPRQMTFDNASMVMIDNQTGQVLGLRGSRDYNYPDYGAVNEATAFIQPGSTIKPLVYSALINNQNNPNGTYGAGSIIPDSPIPQSIYTTSTGSSVNNSDLKFKGNIPIRQALAESRNVPAIKTMALNGISNTWDVIRAMGDVSYCTDGVDQHAGLASAIGGCGAKQIEHANAFATIARMGMYEPLADVIEVKNYQGQSLYQWKDEGKQVIDPQTAYIISDILTDDNARQGLLGKRNMVGFVIPGIKTATKTGTTDMGGIKKDMWMMSFTPKATLSIWCGSHIPSPMKGYSYNLAPMIASITTQVYNNVFIPDGTYKKNDWFAPPNGIQKLSVAGREDIFPSWYNKNQKTSTKETITFDKVSKKKATDCTPDGAKEDIDVVKMTDPVTKAVSYTAPDGYDVSATDDFHHCDDVKPFISVISASPVAGTTRWMISARVLAGTNPIAGVIMTVNGANYNATLDSGSWDIVLDNLSGAVQVDAVATDSGFYTGSASQTLNFANASGGGSAPPTAAPTASGV